MTIMLCAAIAGTPLAALGASISDYTAFPPFLPRVVSPNILFLLDYSKSMVRPAYGLCSSELSDCQTTFAHLDDYSSTTPYPGYFEIGSTAGAYSDARASKYNCSANGLCSKETDPVNDPGEWNGNWLNWLTMTQFDIMKEVFIGGDVNPAPEGQQSGSPTKQSQLVAGFSIYKAVSQSSSSGRALVYSSNTPQPLPYKWIDTPAGTASLAISSIDDALSAEQDIPFIFTFYGNAYSQLRISTNGFLSFTDTSTTGVTNYDMPSADGPENIIAPYWDDLDPSKGGTIKTFTVGTSPNRIYVVSYENIIAFADAGKADPLTFQILLFEGSNHIVFQYKKVTRTSTGGSEPTFVRGLSATVGVENLAGTLAKKYSYNGSTPLTDQLALFITPLALVYKVTPQTNASTIFQPAPPLAVATGPGRNDFNVKIDIKVDTTVPCPEDHYNGDKATCYDHITTGLFHTFRDAEKNGTLGFRIGFMRVGQNNNDGAEIKTKGKYFNSKDTSNLFTQTRGNGPVDKAPLAEALYEAMRYFRQDEAQWSNDYDNYNGDVVGCPGPGSNTDPYCFTSASQKVSCAKSFALLISSGNYSDDNGRSILDDTVDASDVTFSPSTDGPLTDYWRTTDDSGAEGTRVNGGWLDNVAYKARTTDLRDNAELEGLQSLTLYTVNTFSADNSRGAQILKKASRWGGFRDLELSGNTSGVYDAGDCSADPKVPDEADIDCNGVPDTYFAASGGSNLKAKIEAAVSEILRNSASGTSVSVLSTSAGGEGALYQAYFYPAKTQNQTEDRKWPGFLRTFFLDGYQNLRDDYSAGGTGDHGLVYTDDRVIEMALDSLTNEVKVSLYTDSDGSGSLSSTERPASPPTVAMDAVLSIWEGGEKLARRDKSQRNIYLWLDDNTHDGVVDQGDFNNLSGEARSFVDSEASDLWRYLQAADTTEAANIINFIRGSWVDDYRNRCIVVGQTQSGCGSGSGASVWPLGDIVYSTPTLVSAPGEKFHLIYSGPEGASYRAFATAYKNRRQMVYVGANDGLLHAFNAGVYYSGDRPDNDTGTPSPPAGKAEVGYFKANPPSTAWSSAELGEERWAFLPYDNLPHLVWLTCAGTDNDPAVCSDAEYTHVFYVDHRPKVTDARIFSYTDPDPSSGNDFTGIAGQPSIANDLHTRGWGTILILPLRFGGGAINVDLDGDGLTNGTGEQSFRSAYYALDITDPEKKPRLLWRFTHANLGFSTSYPGIVRVDDGTTVKWFMVVGSGPTNSTAARDYGTKNMTQTGKVFVVDLADGTLVRAFDTGFLNGDSITGTPYPPGTANSVMGDPTVVDVDLNFSADVIYIGSAVNNTGGRVFRINTHENTDPNNWDFSTLFDPVPGTAANTIDADPDNGKDMGPLLVGPSVSKDIAGNLWTFFGTGRLRTKDDNSNSQMQRFYGIKDKCWKSTQSADNCDTASADNFSYKLTDLLDTSAVTITTATGSDTQVSAGGGTACGDAGTNCKYQKLLEVARSKKGWHVDLAHAGGPSERVLSRSSILGGLVLFTTFQPSSDQCSVLGDSDVYALYYETGTAYNKPVVGTYTLSGTEYVKRSAGDHDQKEKGMPTSVGIAVGADTISGFVQNSTGEIIRIEAAPGLGVRSGTASWREKAGAGGTVEIETIYKHIVK